MKFLILLVLSSALNLAFAGETNTDCAMMKQGRGNPKASLASQPKLATRKSNLQKASNI
jgi:hypothetical protein